MIRLIIILFLWLIIPLASNAQKSTIKVVDSKTLEPIPYASVKLTQQKSKQALMLITDANGLVTCPYNDSTIINVSYTGYKSNKISVFPNRQVIVKLDQSNIGLPELVVSANFVPVTLKESVYDIKTISEQKIANSGSTTLREALNTELNFKTNNGHVNETAINLNGLSGNHVKFMIDGVPVEGRLSGNIDVSQLNLNDVERIEIIDGPTSVAYGTNALGGTINIITKKNQQKATSFYLKSYYETVGQYNISAGFGFKLNDYNFKISGGRNFFNGFSNPDTSRFKTWKPREQYFAAFMFNKRIKGLKLTYSCDGFTELMTSRGEPRAPYYITAFDSYFKTNKLINKVLLNGKLQQHLFFDFTLSQSYYLRSRNIYFKDLTTLDKFITDSDSDQDTTVFNNYLLRTVLSKRNDSLKINYSIGVELKNDNIIAERVSNTRQQVGEAAAFVSIDYKPISKLTIKPAIRYAYNTKYKAPLIPSLNFLYVLNSNSDFRASYAKGFRAPDLKELYLEFHYSSAINLWGNKNLLAENSDHLNLSFNHNFIFGKSSLLITPKIFCTKINNLIGLVQTSDVDWTYTNINYLLTKGTSLNTKYQFNKLTFNTGVNYYGQYNSAFNSSQIKNKFFYTCDFNSSLSFNFDSIGLSASVNYKYNGKVRNYYLADNNVVKESFVGNYSLVDFNVTKYLFNKKVNVTAGVKNIFNVTSVLMTGDVFGISNQSNANSLSVLWGRTYFVSIMFNI